MIQPYILIIDDEAPIRKLLEITLHQAGYKVALAASARQGLVEAGLHPPDLILLDLGLPDEDGQEVLKQLREWYTHPILILSVRNSEEDIVKALDNGANDYLVKPFRKGELLARIRSAMRSTRWEDSEPIREFGGLRVDLSSRVVRKHGESVKLTTTEYALLALFVRNEGRVLTYAYILKEIWGPGYVNQSQYPRVFVGQLRKKIENNPNQPQFIQTESGVGYRFTGPEK